MAESFPTSQDENSTLQITKTQPARAAVVKLTEYQLTAMRNYIHKTTHPSKLEREELAAQLDLTYDRVTNWFNNERQRLKKKTGIVPRPKRRRLSNSKDLPSSASMSNSKDPLILDNSPLAHYLRRAALKEDCFNLYNLKRFIASLSVKLPSNPDPITLLLLRGVQLSVLENQEHITNTFGELDQKMWCFVTLPHPSVAGRQFAWKHRGQTWVDIVARVSGYGVEVNKDEKGNIQPKYARLPTTKEQDEFMNEVVKVLMSSEVLQFSEIPTFHEFNEFVCRLYAIFTTIMTSMVGIELLLHNNGVLLKKVFSYWEACLSFCLKKKDMISTDHLKLLLSGLLILEKELMTQKNVDRVVITPKEVDLKNAQHLIEDMSCLPDGSLSIATVDCTPQRALAAPIMKRLCAFLCQSIAGDE